MIFGLVMEWGVLGIQAGSGVAIVLQSIAYGLILACKDWQKIATEVELRIKQEAVEFA